MKTKHLFRLTLLLLSVVACSNPQQEHQESTTAIAIELNNGQKWQVNAEMMPHIKASEALLADYVSTGSSDYQQLANDLKTHNNQLIASCTMKGKSHDELHKWLLPHLELVAALKAAPSVEESNSVVTQLQQSFTTLNAHFE